MKEGSNKKGLTGPEYLFIAIIIALIVLTGFMAHLITKIGPEDDPHFVIQDVYYEQDGGEYSTHLFLTNAGEPKGKVEVRWKVTSPGDKLVANGTDIMSIDGTKTREMTFNFSTAQYDYEDYTMNIEIFHDGKGVDMYEKDLV